MAYEGLCKKVIIFTELDEDFEDLGMMKKTSLNVCTGPECSYTFLHLTLQEYMAALYIALMQPSDLNLDTLENKDVVVRFLAGLSRHDEHSHVRDLIRDQCDPNDGLQLVHCCYECPSIMNSMKENFYLDMNKKIAVHTKVGFDWYVTGYCIGHFDENWSLYIDEKGLEIDLFLKGLGFSPKGKIRHLYLVDVNFSQLYLKLRSFSQLASLQFYECTFDHDDQLQVILRQLIAPEGGLRKLVLYNSDIGSIDTLVPMLFGCSSLKNLQLFFTDDFYRTDLLPHCNQYLSISSKLIPSLASILPNITNLTYLGIDVPIPKSAIPVLVNIIQSHPTLGVLELNTSDVDVNDWTIDPRLKWFKEEGLTYIIPIIDAAKNNSKLAELVLLRDYYDCLPLWVVEENKKLLGRKYTLEFIQET